MTIAIMWEWRAGVNRRSMCVPLVEGRVDAGPDAPNVVQGVVPTDQSGEPGSPTQPTWVEDAEDRHDIFVVAVQDDVALHDELADTVIGQASHLRKRLQLPGGALQLTAVRIALPAPPLLTCVLENLPDILYGQPREREPNI